MKIWYGYGSEHSMNLVMIGYFKNTSDAQKTKSLIDRLTEKLSDKISFDNSKNRIDDDVKEVLGEEDCYMFYPVELEQFLYDIQTRLEDDKIILRTDESEVSAFFKLMVRKGARVEVYSAHDFPEGDKKEE